MTTADIERAYGVTYAPEAPPSVAFVGPLAASLAKAQATFPTIPRDKEVTVQTKTGGSYKFKYAPLDSILAAVRGPLADNGLAITQLLDGPDLVTMLLHESGAVLSGRVALPRLDGANVQALGSAITYLRRYSLQAILGIAAEEDDDGNHASGNTARPSRKHPGLVDGDPIDLGRPELERRAEGLIGTIEEGKPPVDLELRQTTEGSAFGFKLKAGRKGYPVLATGPLADALAIAQGVEDMQGVVATVWGHIEMVPWQKKQPDGSMRDMAPYARIRVERVQTPGWTLPAPSEPETVPMGLVPEDDLSDLDF